MVARDLRLRSPIDFEHARSHGTSWTSDLLVAVVLPNDRATNRYGFAVGRRVGSAVARNRAKRLMRESVRHLHPRLEQGYDIVFIARNRVNLKTRQAEISRSMESVLDRAGLLFSNRPGEADRSANDSSEPGH